MKSMDIDKVIHFPFPTPPDIQQLFAAERRLLLLNALEPPPRNIKLKRNPVFILNETSKCKILISLQRAKIGLQRSLHSAELWQPIH